MTQISEEATTAIDQLDQKRQLTPNKVVEIAKDPESPLHGHFCWDDNEAAHQYRLEQARSLIRVVRIEIIRENVTILVPRWVRDPQKNGDEQGYTGLLALQRKPKQSEAALLYELRRAMSFLQRAIDIGQALGSKTYAAEMRSMARAAAKLRSKLEPDE